MIKIILLLISFSSHAFSQEFTGCGEYILKGIFKYDEYAPFKTVYIVHEGSNSQMIFRVIEKADVVKIALMIDHPSTLKASITKPMDGTSGVITLLNEIELRFPDPLNSSDTGIKNIKKIKCD